MKSLFILLLFASSLLYGVPNNDFTPFVVDQGGTTPYNTIQAAVNAALPLGKSSTILVRPGTYSENIDFTLGGTVLNSNLTLLGAVAGSDNGQCEIIGRHNPPQQGSLILRNFKLSHSVAIFSSQASGTAHLALVDAFLNVSNGYTWNLPNWQGIIEMFDIHNSNGQYDGVLLNTAGATLNVFSSSIGAGASFPMIVSGPVVLQGASLACPVEFQGNSEFDIDDTIFANPIHFSGNSSGSFRFSSFKGDGVNPVFRMDSTSIIRLNNVVIDSPVQVITGSGRGILNLGLVSFLDNATLDSNLNIVFSNAFAGEINANGFTTSQNISTTNGNLVISGLGKGFSFRRGQNSRASGYVLTNGAFFVKNPTVTQNTMIYLTRCSVLNSTALGQLQVAYIQPGVGFAVNSINPSTLKIESRDNSSFCFLMVEIIP